MQRQALVESLARDRDRKLMLERLYNDASRAFAEPSERVDAPQTAASRALAESSSSAGGQLETRLDPSSRKAILTYGEPQAGDRSQRS